MGEGTVAAVMPPKIAGALVKASRAAHAVEKKGTVKTNAYSYRFAGADALMSEAREALAEAGLAIVLTRWWPVVDDTGRTLFAAFLLCHEDGDTHEVGPYQMPVIERAGSGSDKCDASALTYATGYVMRGLLNLPRVEEGSQVDERDDSQARPRGQEAPPPKPSALELIATALSTVEDLPGWCDEYGAKAAKAVGLEKLRAPLLTAAKRLGVSEGEALAMIAKAIGDAKRGQ